MKEKTKNKIVGALAIYFVLSPFIILGLTYWALVERANYNQLYWDYRDNILCGLDTVECPGEDPVLTTTASWYDYSLEGDVWSKDHRTVASRDYPRGTLIKVTNAKTGKSVEVVVNDYGPDIKKHPGRALDLSSYAFSMIADLKDGTVEVQYQVIGTGAYEPIANRVRTSN